jgi:hypothetical protein
MGGLTGTFGVRAARAALREHDALLRGPRILGPKAAILRRIEDLDPELDLEMVARLQKVDPEDPEAVIRALRIDDSAVIRGEEGQVTGIDMDIVEGRVPAGVPRETLGPNDPIPGRLGPLSVQPATRRFIGKPGMRSAVTIVLDSNRSKIAQNKPLADQIAAARKDIESLIKATDDTEELRKLRGALDDLTELSLNPKEADELLAFARQERPQNPSETFAVAGGSGTSGWVDENGNFVFNKEAIQNLLFHNTREGAEAAQAAAEGSIKKAFGLERLLQHLNPTLRISIRSMSANARQILQQLAETSIRYEGNAFGIVNPLSAENAIIGWNRELAEILEELPRAWVRYRLGRDPKFGDVIKLGLDDALSARVVDPDGPKPVKDRGDPSTFGADGPFAGTNDAADLQMTYHEFLDRVGYAMRRSDRDLPNSGVGIPEVMESAAMIRKKLFDPTKKDAIELGFFEEGDAVTQTAESYLTRVYHLNKLKQNPQEFDAIVAEWLLETVPPRVRFLAETEDPTVKTFQGEQVEYTLKMALDDAARIRHQILANPASRQPWEVMDALNIGPAKALQKRAFAIPDERIEQFLVNNVEDITRFYVRTVIPDIELARAFGSFNMEKQLGRGDDPNNLDQAGTIWKEYDKLLEQAPTKKDFLRISKQRDADIRDLTAIRDILRGTYAAPGDPDSLPIRARIITNRFNYLIQGGTFVLSSIPDVARVVMTDGVTRVWSDALRPMITDWNRFKLAAKEAKLAGVAWDTILNTRAMNLFELGDDYGRGTRVERMIRRGSDQFANLSLLSPWNTAMKQFAGVVVQARLGEAIIQVDQLLSKIPSGRAPVDMITKKADIKLVQKLSDSGIPLSRVRGLAEQMRRAGVEGADLAKTARGEPNLWHLKTEAWANMDDVKLIRGALRREVDKIIVTPGAGDRPLWMSTELGRLIGQYRSFSFAATQRVLIPGLQELDRNFMNGTIFAISMGMVGTKLKNDQFSTGGRDDLRYWIAEGIDSSGVTGILANFNQDISTLTRGQVRMGNLIGAPNMDQFTNRGFVSVLGGPTVSTLNSLSRVTQDLFPHLIGDGSVRRRDVNAARRLFPTNNIFYLDSGYDALEKGTRDSINFLEDLP